MRLWHELRVREKVGPNRWVKKSKFYCVHRPSDAVRIYQERTRLSAGEYVIMWCEKDRRHSPERPSYQIPRIMAEVRAEQTAAGQGESIRKTFGEFLGLGGELLGALSQKETERSKVIKRRINDQREKETAHFTV